MLICEDCGSRSVVMELPLRDAADVVCAECGLYLGSYPDVFARFASPPEAGERKAGKPVPRSPEPLLLGLVSSIRYAPHKA